MSHEALSLAQENAQTKKYKNCFFFNETSLSRLFRIFEILFQKKCSSLQISLMFVKRKLTHDSFMNHGWHFSEECRQDLSFMSDFLISSSHGKIDQKMPCGHRILTLAERYRGDYFQRHGLQYSFLQIYAGLRGLFIWIFKTRNFTLTDYVQKLLVFCFGNPESSKV